MFSHAIVQSDLPAVQKDDLVKHLLDIADEVRADHDGSVGVIIG